MQIEFHDRLTDQQIAEWDEFLLRAEKSHPRQSPKFAAVERALGNVVLHAVGRENGRICAVGLFSLRRHRFIPGRFSQAAALSGPVCDNLDTLTDFLAGIARSKPMSNVDALTITPYWVGTEAPLADLALGRAGWKISDAEPFRHTGLIDITCPPETLRASFSSSARRKLRLIEASQIKVRTVSSMEDARVFFDYLNRLVLLPHRLTPVSVAEYEAGFQEVYREGSTGTILVAYEGDRFLGGLLLYRSENTAHARRYVADPSASKLRVAPTLWYEGMLWAQRHGCRSLDVEGYRLIEDPSDPMFNVYEYKRELRPEQVLRLGERTLPLHKTLHAINQTPKRLRRLAKRTLVAVKGTFAQKKR